MQYPESPYEMTKSPTAFMYKVYGWMSLALAITAAVAYYVFKSPTLYLSLRTNPWLLFFIIFLQFGLVIALSAFIYKMSYSSAVTAFMVYAVSVGLTMSFIFGAYTTASIYATFIVTAGMFGITCLYGYFTKADLTSMGNFAFMGLIGLILAFLVNLFLRSTRLDFILSAFGVLIFIVLTAYDTQKIKEIGQKMMISDQARKKFAIVGALTLYLDFINLFLFFLRFMGQSKEN